LVRAPAGGGIIRAHDCDVDKGTYMRACVRGDEIFLGICSGDPWFSIIIIF